MTQREQGPHDGAEAAHQDDVALPPRNSPPAAPWVGRERDESDDPWIGKPVHRRPMSPLRWAAVGLISAYLIALVVDMVRTYAGTDSSLRPGMTLGVVYGLAFELIGWSLVVWIIRRR